jgi:hypothetical protein
MRSAATLWSWTARSMALGAAYDAAFAVAILFFADASAALMRIPLPADRVYFRFIGVFLVLLAAMYVLPAREPQRYQGVVVVAAAGRFLGFLYLAWAWSRGAPGAFLALACADLALSALHAFLLQSARRAEGPR